MNDEEKIELADWKKPIDILLVTYQRVNFLKETVESINKRTFYPFRLIVVYNPSTDGTKEYLKQAKIVGKVSEIVWLEENLGQSHALNEGFKMVKSDYFVTTQDDLLPPDLRPCWLERLKHLFEKYHPDYGSICMRIQRTKRLEWDENSELIDTIKSMPSVFRIQKTSDFKQLGDRPFGKLNHWESRSYLQAMGALKKKYAMATHLYADHTGYMARNKGYEDGFTHYFTYSPERVDQGNDKPYPIIDPRTNIPLQIVHGGDREEHEKREKYWNVDTGLQGKTQNAIHSTQRGKLAEYVTEGLWLDLGCGVEPIPGCIGIDTYPFEKAHVIHDCTDLWFYKDGEVDGILASHNLEHLPDTKKALFEWDRVLKVGGTLAYIVPDAEMRPSTLSEPSHKVALTKPVLRHLYKYVFPNYEIKELRNLDDLEGHKAKRCILCVVVKKA